jgi:ATP-dependent Lon protease
MAKDNQNKLSKKEMISKRSKRLEELRQKKKKNESSDSDNHSDSESEEMDVHEYRKFISKIFPSKHMNTKVKAGEDLKKVLENDISDEEEEEEKQVKPKKKNNKGVSNKKVQKQEQSDEEEDVWVTASESDTEEAKEPINKVTTNKVKKGKKSVSKSSTKNNKNNKKNNKNNKKIESGSDEETLGSKDTEDDEDDDNDEDDDFDEIIEIGNKKGSSKLNIIFTIGGAKDNEDDDYDDEYDYDYDDEDDSEYIPSDEETEDEDVSVSSDSDEEEEEEEDEENKEEKKEKDKKKSSSKPTITTKTNKNNSKNKKETSDKEESPKKIKKEKKDFQDSNNNNNNNNGNNSNNNNNEEMLVKFKQLLLENPNDKSLQKCVEVYEKDIETQKVKKEKKVKKQKDKNMRIFRKIVRDKNMMNDFSFYEKLELEEQKKIIKELREINKITRIEKPYRMTLLEANIPTIFKGAAMKKINSLRYMEPGSGEFYKIKNWVDTFMRIPFSKYQSLPISIEDGVDKCHDFMENAKNTLDSAVYGLNDAKMQIMQMLGQLVTNPMAIGTAIAINGPPGTGKTSLVKEGISKILNRPFAFIALGGATDSSFLEGHSYTYEGSTWGKIVQILIDSKCMNPVIYFDELDKISETPRGEEITGILTHLTDTSQNAQFHDKYFAEINFDLSKCLFIFSYNDETKVNPILKDRMYRIQTKGYNLKQKTIISNSYLLPRIREQVKFTSEDIIIPDESIHYIVDKHCNKEDGVRNLKRCLEIIYTKINLYRLMKPGSNLFEEDMSLKVEFPFTVTTAIVDKLIKPNNDPISAWKTMFI